MDYLIQKSSLKKNSSGTIQLKAEGEKGVHNSPSRVLLSLDFLLCLLIQMVQRHGAEIG